MSYRQLHRHERYRHETESAIDTARSALQRLRRRLGPFRAHRYGSGDRGEGHGDERDVLAAVENAAADVHRRLGHDNGVFAIELLGATGSGKTALVERIVDRSPPDVEAAVVAADVAGDDDAERYRTHGLRVADVTTGKDCHLTPSEVDDALDRIDLSEIDRLYVENVGNMVCPADFPLGAHLRIVVVSVTEGEDVVRKHPLVFQQADVAVVNKVDVADAVGVDPERMVADVDGIAPDCSVYTTSARTGRGVDDLASLFEAERFRHAVRH